MAIKKGKTLALFSAKGGVGKTITTLNLAGIYSKHEKKVLIIDADLAGGGISVALNTGNNNDLHTLVQDLGKNKYLKLADYIAKYNDHIHLIAAPKDPRQATKIDAKYIDLIIERAANEYDVVLIDTNHYLNDLNLLILDKVDSILFFATNDPLNLKNLRSLINIFDEIGVKKYKVLLNNSVNPYNDYYNLYDIRSILNANIDYTLSPKFFIKNIEYLLIKGRIITLEKRISTIFAKDYKTLFTIAKDLIEPKITKVGENNEQ